MKLEKINAYKYRLIEEEESFALPFSTGVFYEDDFIRLRDRVITAKIGYAYDGPSGPTEDTPDTLKGSMVHDMLCQLIDSGIIDNKFKKQADKLLKDTCILESERLAKERKGLGYKILKAISKPRFNTWEFMVNKFGGTYSKVHKPNKIIEV